MPAANSLTPLEIASASLTTCSLICSPIRGFNRRNPHKQRVGERGRNRTFNLLIKSQLLCQLSYAPT